MTAKPRVLGGLILILLLSLTCWLVYQDAPFGVLRNPFLPGYTSPRENETLSP